MYISYIYNFGRWATFLNNRPFGFTMARRNTKCRPKMRASAAWNDARAPRNIRRVEKKGGNCLFRLKILHKTTWDNIDHDGVSLKINNFFVCGFSIVWWWWLLLLLDVRSSSVNVCAYMLLSRAFHLFLFNCIRFYFCVCPMPRYSNIICIHISVCSTQLHFFKSSSSSIYTYSIHIRMVNIFLCMSSCVALVRGLF